MTSKSSDLHSGVTTIPNSGRKGSVGCYVCYFIEICFNDLLK